MRKNHSPWIHQLKKDREVQSIQGDAVCEVLVVGAGIAGVMTSYFILKNTNSKVLMLDANLVGHGASGHNAGQLTTYFERPLADIATEFGVQMACEGQKSIDSAWKILDDVVSGANIKTPVYKFTGYAGLSELKQVLLHLADNMIRYDGGISVESMLIAEDFDFLKDIPEIYAHLYEVTSRENIMSLLETDNISYIAALSSAKGATNSARICEELVEYMLENYKERFEVYENTKVENISFEEENIFIKVKSDEAHELNAQKLILCTNGFEGFDIASTKDTELNNSFHKNVRGLVNFMSAYFDKTSENPVAISYFPQNNRIRNSESAPGKPYFYMTRRPHMHDGEELGLISTGGPERELADGEEYDREGVCEEWAEQEIDNFLKANYTKYKKDKVEYDFCWHGLLGYTENGLRVIGEDKKEDRLLYNLGCNGIGIMPSIYGADKVSRILKGEKFTRSIFDAQ